MPSEITDKLRLDIRDVMQIPDPELRAQIAVQKQVIMLDILLTIKWLI